MKQLSMLGEVRCSERFSIRFSRFQTESKKGWRTKDGVSCGFFVDIDSTTRARCEKDWKTIARIMVLWSRQIASTAQRHKLRFQKYLLWQFSYETDPEATVQQLPIQIPLHMSSTDAAWGQAPKNTKSCTLQRAAPLIAKSRGEYWI